MKKLAIAAVLVAVLVVAGFLAGRAIVSSEMHDQEPPESTFTFATDGSGESLNGFIYGRVTGHDGESWEGPIRWGGTQEAFWGDYFNGVKTKNRWVELVPSGRLPTRSDAAFEIFGAKIGVGSEPISVQRAFMARFGDLQRIETVGTTRRSGEYGADVRVVLKSGTEFVLERMDASDFDDGIRIWDRSRGAVDLDPRQISRIEFIAAPDLAGAPSRLHGTVRTTAGEFSGYVQWDREECFGIDTLEGRSATGDVSLRFDQIRSIARQSQDGAIVTLNDGRTIDLSEGSDIGSRNRGIYVDDVRFGRVLVPWRVFESLELTSAGSGPSYRNYPPGERLKGTVTARDGRTLSGAIVFDLDESETTETLDAPAAGIDYTLLFGLVRSIERPAGNAVDGAVIVLLHDGQRLELEPSGDLGEGNAGILVFTEGTERPGYLQWNEVASIELEAPSGMYPPIGDAPPDADPDA